MYEDAFSMVEEIDRKWHQDRGWAKYLYTMTKKCLSTGGILKGSADNESDVIRNMNLLGALAVHNLRQSQVYYIGKDTFPVIETARVALVRDTMKLYQKFQEDDTFRLRDDPMLLKSEGFIGAGFAYFAPGARYKIMTPVAETMEQLEGDREKAPRQEAEVVAVQWSDMLEYSAAEDLSDDDRYVAIIVYVKVNKSGLYGPSGVWVWGTECTVCLKMSDGITDAMIPSFLTTFWTFLRDRIFATSQQPMPRSFRKRAQRDKRPEQDLRVVYLRRKEYAHVPQLDAQGKEVEWSCQWMVGAHWHKYHTSDGVVSKYLMPYRKGPADKPFNDSVKKIFAVVR